MQETGKKDTDKMFVFFSSCHYYFNGKRPLFRDLQLYTQLSYRPLNVYIAACLGEIIESRKKRHSICLACSSTTDGERQQFITHLPNSSNFACMLCKKWTVCTSTSPNLQKSLCTEGENVRPRSKFNNHKIKMILRIPLGQAWGWTQVQQQRRLSLNVIRK